MRIAGLGRLQKSEFGRHRLAEHEPAGAPHQRDQRGVLARPVALVDRRAELGREVGGVENIFHADRQSAQRQGREARHLRLAPCARQIERHESADLGLAGVDRLGAQIDDSGRRERARLDAAREIECGQHQAAPSIRPTMRWVTLRANGMAKNAVTAATGQPTRKAESQRRTKSARKPILK